MKPAEDVSNQHANNEIMRASISSASFWLPRLLVRELAWLEHAPFGFWLVDALRPKTIVELGCYSGFSYNVFCQAVQQLSLDCQCYGVDTWQGDKHTGYYGEDIFERVNYHNNSYYSSFSRLIKSSFDDAVQHFSEGTVDLLHIDGAHGYDDVKSDYEHWRSRLSKSAVVLFHDTNVRERGFGVGRLWSELKEQARHFEFVHGNGLGVLGLGDELPQSLIDLFGYASNSDAVNQIRLGYSRLGLAVADRLEREALEVDLRQQRLASQADISKLEAGAEAKISILKTDAAAKISVLERDISMLERDAAAKISVLERDAVAKISMIEKNAERRLSKAETESEAREARAQARIKALELDLARQTKRQSYLSALASQREAEFERLQAELGRLAGFESRQDAELNALRHDRDLLQNMLQSRSWRMTAPYRALGNLFRAKK